MRVFTDQLKAVQILQILMQQKIAFQLKSNSPFLFYNEYDVLDLKNN